ncbi:MAG TPA: hypothetical protein VM143_16030 [Acidimicrobiales bacterium]|nr:hypothetical protein [Acidimicrobiales bacterium]
MEPAPLLPDLPDPDRLDRLVTLLDAACHDEGWHQPHRLVSVETTASTSDDDDSHATPSLSFGFRVLGAGEHPLDHLLGFVAPPSWTAVGLVCFGWASPPAADGGSGRPSEHPDRRRVRVVTLLDRRGDERATATLDDGMVVDEPGAGTVSDALRRCLGLPTPAPPVGSGELFAAIWLSSIAAAGRRLTWGEAAALHPAMRLSVDGGRRRQAEELVSCARALHRAMPWGELRLRAASGRRDIGVGVAPDLAAWMDDGMFSRWVLGGLPPFPPLLQRCSTVLAPEVLRRVRRALRAWNLDPPLIAHVA